MTELERMIGRSGNTALVFAQGARCGFLDGRDRVGAYVTGEEWSIDLIDIDAEYGDDAPAFADGFRFGYRVGASGETLLREISEADLPSQCDKYRERYGYKGR